MIFPSPALPRLAMAALLTLTLALGACSGGDSGGGGGGAAATGPILVGEFGSLTGSEATFGQSTHHGVLIALEEQNAAGGIKGRKVEVKVYDDQGKTQEAGTAVTRLITQDKAVAIIGEVASSLSLAGGRVAQQYGVPMISPSSTNPKVTQIGDMVFRVCFLDSFQGYVAARFARENAKAEKAAILYDQAQAYSTGLKDDFAKAFTDLGGKVVTVQAYTGGDQDYNAQLTAIRGAQPDVIFVPGYYTDVGNIVLQARKLGLTVPLIGGDGWDSAKLSQIAGKALDGCFFANHASPSDDRPQMKQFVAKYKAQHGQTPDALAALGYDAAKLLFAAMEKAPSLAGKDLAAAIAATRDFQGATGVISIDKDRNATKSAVVMGFKDGQPVFVTRIEPPK